jgi:hypothetical protein
VFLSVAEGRRKKEEGARYQALPGNADPEALPPILLYNRGRASGYWFPGRA